MDISNQIKTRREAMGLSQEQLAEKLYVSRQTISNWERVLSFGHVPERRAYVERNSHACGYVHGHAHRGA